MEQDRERPKEDPRPKFPDYDPVRERERGERVDTERRIEREEAFVRTTDVAGHDFDREAWDRGRGR